MGALNLFLLVQYGYYKNIKSSCANISIKIRIKLSGAQEPQRLLPIMSLRRRCKGMKSSSYYEVRFIILVVV